MTVEAESGTVQASGIERRLVYRLVDFWRDLRGERCFPAISSVDPRNMRDRWPQCFVTGIDPQGVTRFTYFGPDLVALYDTDLTGEIVDLVPPDSVLERAVALKGVVLRKQAPNSVGDSLTLAGGIEVLDRVCLLPFSEDDARIDAMMGGLSYKTVLPDDRLRMAQT